MKVDVFTAHPILTIGALLFVYDFSFQDPGHAFHLSASFIAYVKPKGPCVSLSFEVGSTFLILGYFKAKQQKYPPCGVISYRDAGFYAFLL